MRLAAGLLREPGLEPTPRKAQRGAERRRARPIRIVALTALLMLSPAVAAAGDSTGTIEFIDELFPGTDLGTRMSDMGALTEVEPSLPFSPYGGPNTIPLDTQIEFVGSSHVDPDGSSVEPIFGDSGPLRCGEHADHRVLCSDGGSDATAFSDGFDIYVASFDSPFPDDESGAYSYEVFLGHDGGFVAAAPLDLFSDLGGAYVVAFDSGEWRPLEYFVYQEGGFFPAETQVRVAAGGEVVVFVVPGSQDWVGLRYGIYKTTTDRPGAPDTVAALTAPGLASLDDELDLLGLKDDSDDYILYPTVYVVDGEDAAATTAAPTTTTTTLAPTASESTPNVTDEAVRSTRWWLVVLLLAGFPFLWLLGWLRLRLRLLRRRGRSYGRGLLDHLEPVEEDSGESDEDGTSTDDGTSDDTTGTDTTTTVEEGTTGETVEDAPDDGPHKAVESPLDELDDILAPVWPKVYDRAPTPSSCLPLWRECRRLRRIAAEKRLEATHAREVADTASAECEEASETAAAIGEQLGELEGQHGSYIRIAELQQEYRDAQAAASTACQRAAEASLDASTAEADAEAGRIEADLACLKARECEKAAGS